MRQIKRSSVEPWIENVGENGCLEPVLKQKTNGDKNEKKTGSFSFLKYYIFNFIQVKYIDKI